MRVTSSRASPHRRTTSLSFRFWRGKHLGKSKCRHYATSSSVLRTIGERKTLSLAEEIRQYEPIVDPERFLLALPPNAVHCCGHRASQEQGRQDIRGCVVWREPDRGQFGLPIPVNPDHPRGRSDARLARDLLSAARHTTGTSALAEQKRRGAAVWVRRARLARRAGGEGQPGEAHAAHGQATSLAPADH